MPRPPDPPHGQAVAGPEITAEAVLASFDWVWAIDSGHRLVHLSPGMAEALGSCAAKLVGQRLEDLPQVSCAPPP